MRYLLPAIAFYLTASSLQAQTAGDIINELRSINKKNSERACPADTAAAISNRAMNVFLADKTGYLSGSDDLSYFTNYATFNTDEGKFTVRHSFQQTPGIDDPLKNLFSAGFEMNVAGNFAKSFLDKRYENELGISLHYILPGKVKTRFADCEKNETGINQKQSMDALRTVLLQQLETEISRKEADFKTALSKKDAGVQNSNAAKIVVEQNFYQTLKDEYEEKFATLQAQLLTQTNNYKLVTHYWTTIALYAPLFFPKYTVAESLVTPLQDKHSYPLNVLISHTRIWQSSKLGKIFFSMEGKFLFNNSKLAYGLNEVTSNEYKTLGGTDAAHLTASGSDKAYIGHYETFVTPSLTARIVYFPGDSHVGLSVLMEQNFGQYNLLNGKVGIPITLINKKRTPAVDVECYVLFLNIANKTFAANLPGKTLLGLSVGIPFSRLMY